MNKSKAFLVREELRLIDNKLAKLYTLEYPANRVYVTFESEEQQRLAYAELEVNDLKACTNDKTGMTQRQLFRGEVRGGID